MLGLRAMLGIAGLTRRETDTAEVVRNALAAAVQFTSARRGFLVLRDAGGVLRLVSRSTHGACAPGEGRPGLLADVVHRAVTENRSTVLTASPTTGLTAGPDGTEARDGSPPCTAMAAPVRDRAGQPMGVLCVDLPRAYGGFVRSDCTILKGFADQTAAAFEADEMRRRLARHGELGLETAFAGDIQRGLMAGPGEDLGACEAGFAALPATGLGGGILRLARLGNGSHAVLIGRVPGWGAPAALVAVKIGEAFRLLARTARGAGELILALDEAASEGLRHEMRASAALLVLGGDGSRADVALAGDSCVRLGAGRAAAWCPDEGRPLGVRVPGARPAPPAAVPIEIGPGEGVLLLTSGYLHARSALGERYGRSRVEAFARANVDTSADEFARLLAADIERFRASAERTADGSIAFVRRKTAA